MPITSTTLAQYRALFPEEVRKEALTSALDIRKFEIDLYWKRATYFWTLIAACFAGYFALEHANKSITESSHIVACLGLILSIAWYLVGRGSKFWQQNWELHVDGLENEHVGPLHKTVFNQNELKFLRLTGPYAYSPSKINQIVGLLVITIWLVLILRGSTKYLSCIAPYFSTYWWTLGIIAPGILLLLVFGRTSPPADVNFVSRSRAIN